MLVLERRERLGGAGTLERPFADERFVVSPCAYVVGLLDELVIDELDLRKRGLRYWVADPNLWVPFEDGTSFGQWLDDAKTQAEPRGSSASRRRTSRATGPTRSSSTTSASCCARATATPGSATRRPATRSRSCSAATQEMIDLVFEASIADVLDDYIDDERLKTALFGQGIIGTWGGPYDPGTASIKLMHYQGDLDGQGPVWGYVEGGMGMCSASRSPTPPREAGAVLACGVPVAEIIPGEGVDARGRDRDPRRAP